jgi:hypothetical protein
VEIYGSSAHMLSLAKGTRVTQFAETRSHTTDVSSSNLPPRSCSNMSKKGGGGILDILTMQICTRGSFW